MDDSDYPDDDVWLTPSVVHRNVAMSTSLDKRIAEIAHEHGVGSNAVVLAALQKHVNEYGVKDPHFLERIETKDKALTICLAVFRSLAAKGQYPRELMADNANCLAEGFLFVENALKA